MKLTCDHAQLNAGLQTIIGVVDPRHIKPILQQIKLVVTADSFVLSATDLEVGMRYSVGGAEIEEPGEIVLPGARIASIIRELAHEKVRLEADETRCMIHGGGSHFRVLGDRTDEFPEIPAFPEEETIEIEGAVLREMIHKTIFAAAPERMRFALNGVLLVSHEDNANIEMVGTDGRRMGWIKRKAEKKSSSSSEIIVPTKGAMQLERMLSETEKVALRLEERHLFAKTAEAELVAQLVDGKFPNYRAAVPTEMDKVFQVSAPELAGAIRRAALLCNDRSRAVQFDLTPGQLKLTATTPETGEAEVEMQVQYEGEPTTVTLNPDYILDGLKVLGDREVRFEIKDANTACIVRSEEFVYLTMPITE